MNSIHLCRPGKKTFRFLGVVIRSRSRDRATLPTCERRSRETTRENTTRQLCHLAAGWAAKTKQQAGASPVTAEAIGSGSAALAGYENIGLMTLLNCFSALCLSHGGLRQSLMRTVYEVFVHIKGGNDISFNEREHLSISAR